MGHDQRRLPIGAQDAILPHTAGDKISSGTNSSQTGSILLDFPE
jgi:hypothetical protein